MPTLFHIINLSELGITDTNEYYIWQHKLKIMAEWSIVYPRTGSLNIMTTVVKYGVIRLLFPTQRIYFYIMVVLPIKTKKEMSILRLQQDGIK